MELSLAWNQFLETGKVEDYLNYKMNQTNKEEQKQTLIQVGEKEHGRGSSGDRDGIVCHANR